MKTRLSLRRQDSFLTLFLTKPTARKITLLFLFLELFVVFALGFLLYGNSVKTIKNLSVETHRQMLRQLSLSIDTISREVEQYMILLQSEADFSRLPGLFENGNIMGIMEIRDKYKSGLLANDQLHSLLVYYPGRGIIFSPSFGVIPEGTYWDRDFIRTVTSRDRLPNWEPERILYDSISRGKTDVYSIVRPLYYTRNNPLAYIILNINSSYFENLAHVLGSESATELQISNGDGQTLLYYPSGPERTGEEEYLETTILSSESYWTYRARISFTYLFRHVYWVRTVFFILLGITLILGTLLSLLFSSSILRPIVKVAHTLSSGVIADSSGTIYDQINRSIDHLLRENRELESLVEQQLPLLRNQFLDSLVTGRVTNPQTIQRNMSYYDVDLPGEGSYQVILIRLDSSRQDISPLEEGEANPIRLTALHSLRDVYRPCCPAEVLERTPGEFVVVLGGKGVLDGDRILALSREVSSLLLRLYDMTCTIGAGSVKHNISDLPLSHREAKNALQLIRFYEDRQILFHSEIADRPPGESPYPYGEEKEILRAMNTGDMDGARESLKQFFRRLEPENREQTRFAVLQLFFAQRRALHNLGIEFSQLRNRESFTEERILRTSGPEEMFRLLDSLLDALEENIAQRREPAKLKIMETLENHIRENFSEDISLVRLGGLVQLSVPYLSKLYKETRGINLKDFIVEIRIAESKDLLSREDLPVSEVGRMVGYPNVHGFIKFFKKYTGMTPGRFRSEELLSRLGSQESLP